MLIVKLRIYQRGLVYFTLHCLRNALLNFPVRQQRLQKATIIVPPTHSLDSTPRFPQDSQQHTFMLYFILLETAHVKHTPPYLVWHARKIKPKTKIKELSAEFRLPFPPFHNPERERERMYNGAMCSPELCEESKQ